LPPLLRKSGKKNIGPYIGVNRHPNSEAGNDEIQNVNRDFYFVGITF
jgi:hypothetical protein